MNKVIGMTKLKNALAAGQPGGPKVCALHNIRVNGDMRGASGIFDYGNGDFLYVNTEPSCLASLADKVMIRKCRHASDWSGGWGDGMQNIHIPRTLMKDKEAFRAICLATARHCTLAQAERELGEVAA